MRGILIGAGVLALGGIALVDYYSPDTSRTRELSEIQKLAPDVQPPSCFPQSPSAKLFAAATRVDERPAASLDSDTARKSALKHDCIRGALTTTTLKRLVAALGDEGVTLYTTVVERCPVVKGEYPAPACFALDALAFNGSKQAVGVLERAATERKQAKEVWLGSTFRLLQIPSWRTPAQLAAQLAPEPEWEVKELLLEHLRAKRDPSTREALSQAYAAEKDETEKGHIKAALLELDYPGKCVAEDEGRGEDGVCRYVCRDTNQRLRYAKVGRDCPLVRDAPAPPSGATASKTSAG